MPCHVWAIPFIDLDLFLFPFLWYNRTFVSRQNHKRGKISLWHETLCLFLSSCAFCCDRGVYQKIPPCSLFYQGTTGKLRNGCIPLVHNTATTCPSFLTCVEHSLSTPLCTLFLTVYHSHEAIKLHWVGVHRLAKFATMREEPSSSDGGTRTNEIPRPKLAPPPPLSHSQQQRRARALPRAAQGSEKGRGPACAWLNCLCSAWMRVRVLRCCCPHNILKYYCYFT